MVDWVLRFDEFVLFKYPQFRARPVPARAAPAEIWTENTSESAEE
jgi:hypothetical protein